MSSSGLKDIIRQKADRASNLESYSTDPQIIHFPFPQWETVHFDVDCGRCGAKLNGQTEPTCPQCSLDLEWDQVLPVEKLICENCEYHLFGLEEPRCPECGEYFEWKRALEIARIRPGPVFENQCWQWDKSIPSLIKTYWLAAFRPRKLWANYHLHSPIKIFPLILFAVIQVLIFRYGWQATSSLATASMNQVAAWMGSRLTFSYPFRGGFFYLPWRAGFNIFPFMASWYIGTFLSLQMFILSKRIFRVRSLQILRVFVHSTAFASLVMVLWCLGEAMLDSSLLFVPYLQRIVRGTNAPAYRVLADSAKVLAIIVTWAHLWIGYHYYLKMPRGWGIGIMSLVLGSILARIVLIYI